jgi:hypothetical protein
VFVFDVISLPFSFPPVGDVSDDDDDDDAVTDVIRFSCIFLSPFTALLFYFFSSFCKKKNKSFSLVTRYRKTQRQRQRQRDTEMKGGNHNNKNL